MIFSPIAALMPGTIQVSVLEFLPPQPSTSFSDLSLKISMGKMEYQTFDRGDFSFPLTNLRDNLIVSLQNAEGKEISHSAIRTKVVIEKGVWDDLFPLEGGGQVRMKLQFLLSEEDRHRIRIMRQSALKKKHDELLMGEVKSPKQSTMIHSYSASSFPANKEVSDTLLQNEVIQAILPPFKIQNSFEKESDPNDSDRYKEPSSSSTVLRTIEAHLEELNGRLSERTAINVSNFEETSSMGISGTVLVGKPEAEKRNPFKKNPSKIRNMISAFESSLNQDTKPKIRPPSVKSQLSKNEARLPSERLCVNEVDAENTEVAQLSERVKNPLHITKGEDKNKTCFVQPTDNSKELTTVFGQIKNKAKIMHKVGIQEEKISSEDSARTLTGKKASVSGQMLSEKHKHPSNNLSERKVSGENLLKQKNRKEIQANNLQQGRNQRASAHVHNASKCDGAWIFPEGGKRVCITAGGKKIMDLMEDFHSESRRKPTKMCSETENLEEVKEDSKAPGRNEKSKTEDSTDAETSQRPVGKVMRVMIMVGFAALVFFTRQRN